MKAEEELITMVMKSEVLTRALEENAADWCVVEDSRLFNGDMQLCSPDDERMCCGSHSPRHGLGQ